MSDENNWRYVKKKGRGRRENWREKNNGDPQDEFAANPRARFSQRRGGGRSTTNQTPQQSNNRKEDLDSSFNTFSDQKTLQDLIENQTIEHITQLLTSSDSMKQFSEALTLTLPEDIFVLLLKLIAKACDNTFVTSKSCMLKNIMQRKFVTATCTFFSGLLISENTDPIFWDNIDNLLNCVLILLENSMQLIPLTCWEQIQTITKSFTLILPVLQQNKRIKVDAEILSRLDSIQKELVIIENKFKKTEIKSVSKDAELEPPDDYRYLDIYPSTEELIISEKAFVRQNIVDGKYPSIRDYLDIHFRLLREDFLKPIREDVCDFLNNTNRHLFNIKIHWNVVFLYRDIIGDTVAYKAKFNLTKGLENMLESNQNKRFMHGSLLIFSDDNFRSLFCGKIVGSEGIRNGHLLVDLHGHPINDYSRKYTMIECVIFFEPYYQVLNVFQRLSVRSLPMERYILNVQTNISHPKYMETVGSYRLPKHLNPSQASALNAALNKEFVIIQGPPGTGKTYLGMQLIKMLLGFKERDSLGPIVIITFTNHALEQFLHGIREFTKKIVRLGRGSDDLRLMKSKFGPNEKLREFLMDNGFVRRLVGWNDDMDIHYDPELELNSDIERLIRVLYYSARYGTIDLRRKFQTLTGDLDRILVPASIRSAINDKMRPIENYRLIKEAKEEILRIRIKLDTLIYIEPQGIFFDIFSEGMIQKSYLEGSQLLEWLLFNDGTILFTKKEITAMHNQVPDPFEEENNIFYLCNFVFRDNILNNEPIRFVTIESLEKKSNELTNFIKMEKGLRESQRKFFRTQLEFFVKKINYLQSCLEIDFEQPEVNFDDFDHPFMIPAKNRWQLYKFWLQTRKANLQMLLDQKLNEQLILYATYNDLREMENVKLLKNMDIIGMTTTCAARNRPMLEAIQSPIVLVEEAAEVLESHIVTALTTHCQHLILLGDHQQLRPTTSDYTMDRKYKLGISLFERMILNNVECHTLNVQHRMRPEISSLISPVIYKELYNSESVEMYPPVSGVKHPLFFIDHIELEQPYGDSSKKNVHEAKFLIQLAIYLLNNNYKPSEITILAAYLGQMYELKDQQKKINHEGLQSVRVAVVDNFQGEENKIILLSLVRNNLEKKIGFLATDNRICVALSRAKEGFYIMGNMEHLCNKSEIWRTIRSTLEAQGALGRYLTLQCKIHQEHITLVSKETDFEKVPEGGCDQVCHAVLECGHYCTKICHGYDLDHKLYNCEYKCGKTLCPDPTHKCKNLCFERCGICTYKVQRQLPCGHEKSLACHVVYEKYLCKEPKEIHPECGHVQNVACSQNMDEFKCQVEVERMLKCQHLQKMPCSEDADSFICQFKMDVTLQCGHVQNVACSQNMDEFKCQVEVERMLKCQHLQKMPCSEDADYFICQLKIDVTLRCGHKQKNQCGNVKYLIENCQEACTRDLLDCNDPQAHGKCDQLCSQPCKSCTRIVYKSYTDCSHIEKLECSEANPYRKCEQPCSKKLACGHICKNKCFEQCTIVCDQYASKTVPECGHKIKVICSETPLQRNCKNPCKKTLSCGHPCKEKCNEDCSKACIENCKRILDCGHACIKKCNEACACRTEIIPECGHSIEVKCGEKASQENCQLECIKTLPCGHQTLKMVKCNTTIPIKCKNQCEKLLECGHPCKAKCGGPCSECLERCKKTITCGHACQTYCSLPCTDSTKCLFPCEKLLVCGHPCKAKCGEPCSKCLERCKKTISCGHVCQTYCSLPCTDSTKCLFPCQKLLACGHKCQAKCYQKCPVVCRHDCDKTLKCGHKCGRTCGEDCSVICLEDCETILNCGHQCGGGCSQPCNETCLKQCNKLLSCGRHRCRELCGDPCPQICQRSCGIRLDCGHLCRKKCQEQCICERPCRKMLPCNHIRCQKLCSEPCGGECNEKCEKILECGHTCINLCKENCACSFVKSNDCVHYVRVKCGETPTKKNCGQLCDKLLDCGHYCQQQCKQECLCLASCRRRLKCGCLCIKAACSEPCECRNKCSINAEDLV